MILMRLGEFQIYNYSNVTSANVCSLLILSQELLIVNLFVLPKSWVNRREQKHQ